MIKSMDMGNSKPRSKLDKFISNRCPLALKFRWATAVDTGDLDWHIACAIGGTNRSCGIIRLLETLNDIDKTIENKHFWLMDYDCPILNLLKNMVEKQHIKHLGKKMEEKYRKKITENDLYEIINNKK